MTTLTLPAISYSNPIDFKDGVGNAAPMGDPFVMKYNGVYYCYVSGGNCWESLDMVSWSYVGKVFTGEHSQNLYAPEVFHWNGAFYCLACPDGTTNYLFKSESPTGPFVAISDALGGGIDGSLFRDDDGSIWFTHAAWNGIELYKLETPESPWEKVATLSQSMAGMWTEGPAIFKRDGLYYMTFTGNHVLDTAYRVEYAVSESIDSGWYEPAQNILLLSTEGETVSLGHNSVVLGPDLDSYYMVYHNRYQDNSHGIDRGFNMQKILWNEEKPYVALYTNRQNDPALPAFSFRPENGTQALDGIQLSDRAAEKVFTAEFNLIPKSGSVLFGYEDEQNYCRLHFSDSTVTLERVTEGKTQTEQAALAKNTDINALQCIRVQQSDTELCVYLEGGLLLKTTTCRVGKIGYQAENGTVGYMAFSNKALGNLDHTEQKFVSNTYSAALANNRAELEVIAGKEIGSALRLQEGDKAEFNYTVVDRGNMTVALRGSATNNTAINLYVNGECVAESIRLKSSTEYYTEILRGISIPRRDVSIQIEVVSGAYEFYEITVKPEIEVTPITLTMSSQLAGFAAQEGKSQFTGGKLILTSTAEPADKAENFAKNVMGNYGWGDYSVSVKLALRGNSSETRAGIYLRAENVSDTASSNFRFKRSWYKQCYFVCVTKGEVRLYKQNFSEELLASEQISLNFSSEHTLKVSAVGATITVSLDGVEMIRYTDTYYPFTNGKAGLQVVEGSASFDDLTVEPISWNESAESEAFTTEAPENDSIPQPPANPKKAGNYLPYVIGGAVALLAAGATGVILLRTKKNKR